jgi:hypothetical protein
MDQLLRQMGGGGGMGGMGGPPAGDGTVADK